MLFILLLLNMQHNIFDKWGALLSLLILLLLNKRSFWLIAILYLEWYSVYMISKFGYMPYKQAKITLTVYIHSEWTNHKLAYLSSAMNHFWKPHLATQHILITPPDGSLSIRWPRGLRVVRTCQVQPWILTVYIVKDFGNFLSQLTIMIAKLVFFFLILPEYMCFCSLHLFIL